MKGDYLVDALVVILYAHRTPGVLPPSLTSFMIDQTFISHVNIPDGLWIARRGILVLEP